MPRQAAPGVRGGGEQNSLAVTPAAQFGHDGLNVCKGALIPGRVSKKGREQLLSGGVPARPGNGDGMVH
jgi:hypothetical protein